VVGGTFGEEEEKKKVEWPGLDCPVDEAIGLDDPNNVYSCKATETCCTKKLKPACCATKPTADAIIEQVELWGSLLVLILCLGLFIWFCRSDASLLDGETPCLHKFCCCMGYKKRGNDGHLDDKTESEEGSQVSLRSSKSTVILLPEDEAEAVKVEDNAEHLEAVLGGEDDPPEDEEAAPVDEEAPPADEEAPPAEEEAPPADEEAPPADEEAPPTEEETPADTPQNDEAAAEDAPAEEETEE